MLTRFLINITQTMILVSWLIVMYIAYDVYNGVDPYVSMQIDELTTQINNMGGHNAPAIAQQTYQNMCAFYSNVGSSVKFLIVVGAIGYTSWCGLYLVMYGIHDRLLEIKAIIKQAAKGPSVQAEAGASNAGPAQIDAPEDAIASGPATEMSVGMKLTLGILGVILFVMVLRFISSTDQPAPEANDVQSAVENSSTSQ